MNTLFNKVFGGCNMKFIHLDENTRFNIDNITHYFKYSEFYTDRNDEYQVRIFIIGRKKPIVFSYSNEKDCNTFFKNIDQLITHCKMSKLN